MKESTLVRNHSAAQSVTRSLVNQFIWRLMKESTLMRNHSVAQNVINPSLRLKIWGYIKWNVLLKAQHSGGLFSKRSRLNWINWTISWNGCITVFWLQKNIIKFVSRFNVQKQIQSSGKTRAHEHLWIAWSVAWWWWWLKKGLVFSPRHSFSPSCCCYCTSSIDRQ